MGSFCSSNVFLLSLLLLLLVFSSSRANPENLHTLRGVDIVRPVLDVTPSPLSGHSATHGAKDIQRCERVQVAGISRLKLGSYASSYLITLAPSAAIPERLHNKIQVCFHRNNSLGWCQCEKDEWKSIQKGIWSAVSSPYETRYVDVRISEISGSVTVVLEQEFQQWRLICLALGLLLLLLAPIISSWVPFYYSSSMAIGIFLVIIILLFQGMKLLPTGRKSIFYFTIYSSVFGAAGSFLLHQFSVLVNSILQSFGMSEEMHNPVAVFTLLGIVLAGAALGYWIVRRFVISKEDGSVDAGVAQFVKWAMRIIGGAFILQSTLDTPLAWGALISSGVVCNLVFFIRWLYEWYKASRNDNSLQLVRGTLGRAEFLSKSSTPKGKMWNSPKRSAWSDSPVRGVVSPSSGIKPQSSGTQMGQDYYSTFHKTRNRKRFTKKEWDEFTRDSTKQALAEWAASPEFTDWMIEHADRIQLLRSGSSEEDVGSESDSTELGSGNGFRLFNWQ